MKKELMDYIPKKYKEEVADFHKENELSSYWLSLKPTGKYILDGYYSDYVIHEDTIREVLRVLRGHIKRKQEKTIHRNGIPLDHVKENMLEDKEFKEEYSKLEHVHRATMEKIKKEIEDRKQ